MKLKSLILLSGILLTFSNAYSQYTEDALRFSQAEAGTTARFRALGGAQTALGGDNSSLAGNPAGLGLFTRSEINLTPNFSNDNVESTYFGNSTSIQKDKGGLNQFGLTIYNPVRKYNSSDTKKGWLSFNFGIGYNKTNTFNSSVDYQGKNTKSSYGDYLSDYGNRFAYIDGDVVDNAYSDYLIEYDDKLGYYPLSDVNGNQRNLLYQSGSQSEVNLALGANYENKFYIGGSIGFASLKYNADREFTETGLTLRESDIPAELSLRNEALPYLDANYRASYRSNQVTTGSGINLKLGFIYRATPSFRFGFNFVSPTWYSINDSFSEGLNMRFTKNSTNTNFTNPETEYSSDYSLRTPYKLNGGLAFTVNHFGLITGDVEYVDYSSINFSSNSDNSASTQTNKDIRERYQGAINLKIGAEAKISPAFSLRGGYSSFGNPYIHESINSSVLTGGLGYNAGNLRFDLTYAQSTVNTFQRPYEIMEDYPYFESTGAGEKADVKSISKNVYATISLRF